MTVPSRDHRHRRSIDDYFLLLCQQTSQKAEIMWDLHQEMSSLIDHFFASILQNGSYFSVRSRNDVGVLSTLIES